MVSAIGHSPFGCQAHSDGAPAAIHCRRVSISAGDNRPAFLGGISPPRTGWNARLSPGWVLCDGLPLDLPYSQSAAISYDGKAASPTRLLTSVRLT